MEHLNIFVIGVIVGLFGGAFLRLVGASVCGIRKESEQRVLEQIIKEKRK